VARNGLNYHEKVNGAWVRTALWIKAGTDPFTELVLTDNPVEAACFHYDPTCRSQALYIKTGVYAPSAKLPRRAPRKKETLA